MVLILCAVFTFQAKAQKLLPNELTLSLWGHGFDIKNLDANDIFKVTGFPDFQQRVLDSSDFERQNFDYMNRAYLQFGFEMFGKKEFKHQTLFLLGFGFGNRFLFSNHYGERIESQISIKSGQSTYFIDSIYTYNAHSGLRFSRIKSFNLGLNHQLIKWKLLSFECGFLFDYLHFAKADISYSERETITYSRFLNTEFLLIDNDLRSIPTTMHSFGLQIPLSISLKLSNHIKILSNIFFRYSFTYGYNYFMSKNLPSFHAKSEGSRLTIGYTF